MPLLNRPLSLLFGAYRSEALAVLLLRPEESFHVREMARLTGIPAGSLHRELKTLEEAGFLLREPMGNQVRYRANRSHPIYAELAEIFRKTSGLADVLREALNGLKPSIDLAFVFGSVAQGKERSVSDVDVFVAGNASFADVVSALTAVQPRLGREINPVVMRSAEARDKLSANDRFLTRVAREPKIFLIGGEDDFKQLAENRAA
jgi:predicted nucleotidyltransferase